MIGAVGNELLPQRAKWAKEVYPDCEIVRGDITAPKVFDELVRLHKEKGCTGVIASSPCQSYTLSNSRCNPSDKRDCLFETMLKFVEAINPEWVMVENVPQHVLALLSMLPRK